MRGSLLYYFFKLLRRCRNSLHTLLSKLQFSYYYQLSRRRIAIPSSAVVGRGFSVRSDLSETTLAMGEQFHCRDNFHILLGHGGNLAIGSHCFFNNNCSITCLGNIRVGNNCQFGENVFMYDHNHNYKDSSSLISEQGYNIGEISIGNNCWIGSGVIILKDVVIGDNVVIGAGCVIRQSVPAGSVVYNQQELVVNSTLR